MVSFLEMFFDYTYQLFASIKVPGFDISVLGVFLGAITAVVSIAILKMLFGLGNSAVSGGSSHFTQKGGNNIRMKIAEKRKGDTK